MHTYVDEGRWDCRDLVRNNASMIYQLVHQKNITAVTETNENELETWNRTAGHHEFSCNPRNFKLHQCAVNCYSLWYSGLCPEAVDTLLTKQYEMAKAKLLRYNFIVSCQYCLSVIW